MIQTIMMVQMIMVVVRTIMVVVRTIMVVVRTIMVMVRMIMVVVQTIMMVMAMIMKILIITNLIQRMMIVVLAIMISQSNNSLLPILMILILNQMMNFNDSWILLWILKYQARFRLPDVAINSLIKFFRIVLSDADNERFKNFPTSSYMMRKMLEFGKHSKRYAVCPSCNKLYKESEILLTSGFKCNHVEFLNHPRRNLRKPYGTKVTDRVPITSGFIIKPKMVYPLPSLKAQIIAMYQRPGFESLLEKWTNRNEEAGLYTNIYDGEIWK